MSKTILIVEDEKDLRDLMAYNLEREGYVCDTVADGAAALSRIGERLPDLIVLDRMLPHKSGDVILTALRRDRRTARVPVIMVTAKAEESDELVGFALGADDYVTKPFSMKALVARVTALLRRADGLADETRRITSGALTLDAERYEVFVEGAPVALTATEFRLLQALLMADGRLKSRSQLIDAAVGTDVAVVDRTIDVHIASLRKKLGRAASWIQTVRGVGYTWRQPADDIAE